MGLQMPMKIENLMSNMDKIAAKFHGEICSFGRCQQPPIRSHTIPENYLYKLDDDMTKILTFQPAMTLVYKNQSKRLKKINKDQFSTFYGFCKDHDCELFKLIDLYNGEMNKEKAVLIHYKNICYGINDIKARQLQVQHMAKQNFVSDESENKEHGEIDKILKNGSLLKRLNYCLSAHLHRKKQLEDMIRSKKYDEIEYRVLWGSLNDPCFCGRSSYLLHDKHKFFQGRGYSYMPWVTYMTLLTNNANHLVFCWLKEDRDYTKRLRMIINKKGSKEIIAVLAYACSDALAIRESLHREYSPIINAVIEKFRVY